MPSNYHINPRIRAYGKARIDVTRRAKDEIEWQKLWREPVEPISRSNFYPAGNSASSIKWMILPLKSASSSICSAFR